MRHPSEYTTVPLGGLHVMVVDAGTEIKDERTGRVETVDDTSAVSKGSVLWVTQPVYDALKAEIDRRTPAPTLAER